MRIACLSQRRGHRGRRRRDYFSSSVVVPSCCRRRFLYSLSYHCSLVLFLWNANNCRSRLSLLLFANRSVRPTTMISMKSPTTRCIPPPFAYSEEEEEEEEDANHRKHKEKKPCVFRETLVASSIRSGMC